MSPIPSRIHSSRRLLQWRPQDFFWRGAKPIFISFGGPRVDLEKLYHGVLQDERKSWVGPWPPCPPPPDATGLLKLCRLGSQQLLGRFIEKSNITVDVDILSAHSVNFIEPYYECLTEHMTPSVSLNEGFRRECLFEKPHPASVRSRIRGPVPEILEMKAHWTHFSLDSPSHTG